MSPLFDLHAHFSFKPANSSGVDRKGYPDFDHWRERFKPKDEYAKLTDLLDKTVVKSSQLHGDSATKGKFKVICNALYPLERGFMSALFLRQIATLTGHDHEAIKALREHKESYFTVLEREYKNLLDNQNKKGSESGNVYRLVRDYNELRKILDQDDDTICLLNTVEGAHAFADDLFSAQGWYINMNREENRFKKRQPPRDGSSHFERYIDAMHVNLDTVKSNWAYPPLFITLSHHYYNHLAGHAPSMAGVIDLIVNQDGATLDEKSEGPELKNINYFFLGIQRWGYRFIQQMWSRTDQNGKRCRRILVDVKHMSPRARLDYYMAVKQYSHAMNDRIPIIKSHTAVSGRKSLSATIDNDHKLFAQEKKVGKYFCQGVINLFDDEAKTIIESDGLIGLMVDERRIIGSTLPPEAGMTLKQFNKKGKANRACVQELATLDHEFQWGEIEQTAYLIQKKKLEQQINVFIDELRPAYMAVVFRQLFYIIDLVGKRGWDHLTLGTDYDGVINPIDIYLRSADMISIEGDLNRFWNQQLKSSDKEVKKLYKSVLFSKTPAHWIGKLLWSNGLNFMKKYFTDDYLKDGILPAKGWVMGEEAIV